MTLPSLIGPYSIQAELGRGGMGVVYLAHDPSLLRPVAIKILPDALADDQEKIARFRREARLIASINHPNIAVVHSLERADDGTVFLVMEYIEGESLEARLTRGAIPPADAARICRRVARALEAAHARGIIHRDLKPSNVMLGADDVVKVLDFGLATRRDPVGLAPGGDAGIPDGATLPDIRRSLSAGTPPAPPHDDATLAPLVTREGEILGTPGYASPEQARGLPTDHRTDIFALGCLLYECLAGRRAFSGATWRERLLSVIRRNPEWSYVPPETPDSIRELLASCLAKDPNGRPSAVADARRVLEDAMDRAPSGLTTRQHNLPRELTSFIGRSDEIAAILDLQRDASLLTLTGAGGCGKTRLALKVALELLPDFTDGVWLIELASVTDSDRVPSAVAAVLGVRETPGAHVEQLLERELGEKSVLLILDNCEHLVAACASLAERLLQSCPRLKILTTSREILGITGEVSYRVPSLSLPVEDAVIRPEEIDRYESCRLFVDRARAASPAFRAGEAEAPAIGRICRRLDGIPLAIELAASRVKVLPVEQIEARLHDRFRLLTGGSRTALERHQTLRATLDWSYALLSAGEQRWLRSLSVFSGGWSLAGARDVGGEGMDDIEVLDALEHLADKSLILVEPSAEPPRCRMLEMVRQYAREKCEQEGESLAVRDRHLDHFVALAQEARAPISGGPTQKLWLERLDAEHENLQAAFQWSESSDAGVVRGLMLVSLLAQFWYLRGHIRLARTLLLRALDHESRTAPQGAAPGSGEPADAERQGLRAAARNAAAHFLAAEGDLERARELVREAVDIRRRVGPPLDLARALFTLGANYWMSGRYEEARVVQEESLTIARELGNTDMIANVLNALGAGLFQQGDGPGARRYFEESLRLRRELGDLPNTALVLNNLGTLAALRGEFDAARRLQEEALAVHRELRNPSGIASVLEERGSVLIECGDMAGATRDYAEALQIARRIGETPRLAGLYVRLAAFHIQAGRPGLATAPLRNALEMFREMGAYHEAAEALALTACLAAGRKEGLLAARLFGKADALQGEAPLPIFPGEKAVLDRSRDLARATLGGAELDVWIAAGRALGDAEGCEAALEALDRFGGSADGA